MYLLLSLTFLLTVKSVRELSCEFIIEKNKDRLIDNDLLGRICAEIINANYATLIRFTANFSNLYLHKIPEQVFPIYELCNGLISDLSGKPTGLKKLLEILLELKSKIDKPLTESAISKLKIWQEHKTLKPLINKILK